MKKIRIFVASAVMIATALTAKAQNWGSTPEDSVQCRINTSLYAESYKMKAYADAYEPWKQVVATCPKSSKNLFIRGVPIMKHMINNAQNAEERTAYINELLALYDTQIANFGDEAKTLCMKAYDCEILKGKTAVAEYYPIYAAAVEKGKDVINTDFVYKYFEATITYVKAGLAEATLIVDNYDEVSEILEAKLRELVEAGDTTAASRIRKQINNVEAAFSPYASCEELVNIYGKKFEADPNNIELLKKITKIMRQKGCTNEELFFQATEKLYSLEPSPTAAYTMGQMCLSKKKYSEAAKYLSDAAKGIDGERERYDCYLKLGIAYGEAGSCGAARSAFYEAAKADPTKGEPYIQIANLYAGNHGGVSDGLGGASAYWAAVDKLVRAKNVDPSEDNVARANKLIGIYSSRFPKQDKCFMLDILDGSSFTVGGWIGESTTVRTRK